MAATGLVSRHSGPASSAVGGFVANNQYTADLIASITAAASNKTLDVGLAAKDIHPDDAQAKANQVQPVNAIVAIPDMNTTVPNVTSQEAGFRQAYVAFTNRMVDELNSFWDTYFPSSHRHTAEADGWISRAFAGSTGVDASVENQLYSRGEARVEREYQKSASEADTMWASRGITMPTTLSTAVKSNLRQDADAGLAEASRAIAIKQAELALANAKFAAGLVAEYRAKAIQAVAEFMGAVLGGYSNSIQIVAVQNDAQSKLVAAAAEYYKAVVADTEVGVRGDLASYEFAINNARRDSAGGAEVIKAKVEVALAALRTLAASAASSLNSLHAGATVSDSYGYSIANNQSESYSESRSHTESDSYNENYNYSV